jgi:hypothetical protein
MSEIAPHILELAKREYGENCELVQATEWSAELNLSSKHLGRI